MPKKKQTSLLWGSLTKIVVSFCDQINLCNSLFAHPDNLSLMYFVEIIMEKQLNKWNKITQV